MPEAIIVIQNFIATDEFKAIECFELLDELCENINTVITPHVMPLMNLCLTTATNNSLSDALKIKAINFIGWLAKTKKKFFVKYELIQPIIGKIIQPDIKDQRILAKFYCLFCILRYIIRSHDHMAK